MMWRALRRVAAVAASASGSGTSASLAAVVAAAAAGAGALWAVTDGSAVAWTGGGEEAYVYAQPPRAAAATANTPVEWPPVAGAADGSLRGDTSLPSVLAAIGNTPLLELRSLSAATGCRILAKAEHLNPGGSVKDRPALRIIMEAEAAGRLVPRHARAPGDDGGVIIEATGGNTGIGMALVAAARGYRCIFTMPANVAREKVELMQALGATTVVCPVVPFSNTEEHYYHRAAALAAATPGAVWGNQFEGLANMRAHVTTTGPEIWRQAGGKV